MQQAGQATLWAMLLLAGCSDQTAPDGERGGNATATEATAASATNGLARPSSAADDQAAVIAAVRALHAPYLRDGAEPPSAMDPRRDYSSSLNAVIRAWRAANPGPEPTPLGGADWLCSCQDWDAATAELTVNTPDRLDDGRYRVLVEFAAAADTPVVPVEFLMVRENGVWLLDDILFAGGDDSLRNQLIAETRDAAG